MSSCIYVKDANFFFFFSLPCSLHHVWFLILNVCLLFNKRVCFVSEPKGALHSSLVARLKINFLGDGKVCVRVKCQKGVNS